MIVFEDSKEFLGYAEIGDDVAMGRARSIGRTIIDTMSLADVTSMEEESFMEDITLIFPVIQTHLIVSMS